VRSARLTTQGAKSIQYGRVEVVAKVPKGDWLWPAIWMMPEDSVYGIWPLSGEIDIMESRGNARGYRNGGRETVSSTIHWGERKLSLGFESDLVELKHVRYLVEDRQLLQNYTKTQNSKNRLFRRLPYLRSGVVKRLPLHMGRQSTSASSLRRLQETGSMATRPFPR
jgi:Glycosyl hydrolases family 16